LTEARVVLFTVAEEDSFLIGAWRPWSSGRSYIDAVFFVGLAFLREGFWCPSEAGGLYIDTSRFAGFMGFADEALLRTAGGFSSSDDGMS
jgi:hypothetical protein